METAPNAKTNRINSFTKVMSILRDKGEANLVDVLSKYTNNLQWTNTMREQLRVEYPNQYVAVRDSKVIEKSENYRELLKVLREKYSDAEDIAIDFISAKRAKLLL